jgi:hypothetical protein
MQHRNIEKMSTTKTTKTTSLIINKIALKFGSFW